MSLQLDTEPQFKGKRVIITEDTPDLSANGISGQAQSLIVSGNPWIVYSDKDYKGDFKCFKEGDYSSLSGWAKKIKSVRVVKDGLGNPRITLYEQMCYKGRSVLLTEAVDSLETYDFDKKASSHKVAQGAWIFYSDNTFNGDKMITLKGDDIPDYTYNSWQNKLSSIKPVTVNDE